MSESISGKEPISSNLEREFSSDNFLAYAKMCEEIAITLSDIFENWRNNRKLAILLPSRGAIPIFNGVLLAMDLLGHGYVERINLPPLDCFSYVSKETYKKGQSSGDIEVLIFPFTADLNIRDLVETTEGEEKVVEGMRRFGVRVVYEFFKPPGERDGLEYRLFLAFLEEVEKRKGMVDFYKKFPQVDGLVMIDTVISGRASWTILNELGQRGVKIGQLDESGIIPILVVDVGGEKLKPQFRYYIDRCPHCLKIPRIMTEDRGAALEGVVAVVYPDLILDAHKDIYPSGYPLFGSWHNVPPEDKEVYLGIFNSFLEVLKKAINSPSELENPRRDFLMRLQSGNILRTGERINGRGLNSSWKIESITETSSHVIQISYSDGVRREILRKIARKLND